jgi:uncharacterized protein DUF5677
MTRPGFGVVAKRADALAALVEARLPVEDDVVGVHQAWPPVGPALFSRATGTLRSIMLLRPAGAHNDAARLLRSLYDHVVTFAWLAADLSAERLALWRPKDLVERLKADRERQKPANPSSTTLLAAPESAGGGRVDHLRELSERDGHGVATNPGDGHALVAARTWSRIDVEVPTVASRTRTSASARKPPSREIA